MATIRLFPFGAFVVAATFLRDKAVFAIGDGSVRIADAEAANAVQAHEGTILTAVAVSDGILTGGDDGRVVRTSGDGVTTEVAARRGRWIDQLAAGPNGAVAFGAGKDAILRTADGRERSFEHARTVAGLAFAPKGFRLAVARYNGVTLWWAGTEAAPVELSWSGAHLGVTFSPDGQYVVTAMQENALHGWRLPGGENLRMSGYPAKPRSLSWSVKGRYLATSGAEAAVLWPFHPKGGPEGRQPLQAGGREALATRVACHPREETVAIGYRDGAVAIAPFEGSRGTLVRPPGDGPVSALAWDAAGTRLAFGTEEGAGGIIDFTASA